jgi:hypothetical protein
MLKVGWMRRGTLSDKELALAESKWPLDGDDSASEVEGSAPRQQAKEPVAKSKIEAVSA